MKQKLQEMRTVTSKGQVAIPKSLRERKAFKEGKITNNFFLR